MVPHSLGLSVNRQSDGAGCSFERLSGICRALSLIENTGDILL